MRRYGKRKLVLSLIRSKSGFNLKQKSLFTLIPYPNHSIIHAVPYFMVGIICGPIWGSFPVRDHLRFQFEDHLRSGIICGPGIICGAVQNFAEFIRYAPSVVAQWTAVSRASGCSFRKLVRTCTVATVRCH